MGEKYIIVNSIDELTKNELGEGEVGICYRIDKRVFKKFKFIPKFPELIIELSKLHSENFTFPEEFVYLNKYDIECLQGYFMEYIEGCNLKSIDELTNMKELCITLDELEKEIRDLGEYNDLHVKDLHPDNVLFTPDKKFKVIDTDFSYIAPDDMIYTYRENMQELGNCMLPVFMGENDIKNSEVNYMYNLCCVEAKAKPSRVLMEAIDQIEKETKEEVLTLHDFKEGMKLLR